MMNYHGNIMDIIDMIIVLVIIYIFIIFVTVIIIVTIIHTPKSDLIDLTLSNARRFYSVLNAR